MGNAKGDDSPAPAVVNGQAIVGRQPTRNGLSPLVKISHAETMESSMIFCGRDREWS
jgi:hypothetical protein